MSLITKAIFPVIACHVDEKGDAFPAEQTIAILSGRTEKVVRNGIKGLAGFPDFKITPYITKTGNKSKKFNIKLPSKDIKGRSFPFHRCIIEGGNWQELKPTAQSLYPVMRHFGYFDYDNYQEMIGEDTEYEEFNEVYLNREYECFKADPDILADYSGISRRSISEALNELRDRHLIEPTSYSRVWKVFLEPPKYYKREYLNKKIMQSHRYEIKRLEKSTVDEWKKLPNIRKKVSLP